MSTVRKGLNMEFTRMNRSVRVLSWCWLGIHAWDHPGGHCADCYACDEFFSKHNHDALTLAQLRFDMEKAESITWQQRIDRARKRGIFTTEDYDLAAMWVTCACGRVTADIPRGPNGAPLDEMLADLGCRFYDLIGDDDFDRAEDVLAMIEGRAQVVAHVKVKPNEQ